MNQTFFKIKFEDNVEIDEGMFRKINEIIAKIRFEGFGKILAPRYEYYANGGIVNDLGNKMYLALYILHGDGHELRTIIRNEIKNLGYNYSCEIAMPEFIEIFYNNSLLDDSSKFEKEFKRKINECDGIIVEGSDFKNNYDFAVKFKLQCQMQDFDEKLNEILNFLNNIDKNYFIEYF